MQRVDVAKTVLGELRSAPEPGIFLLFRLNTPPTAGVASTLVSRAVGVANAAAPAGAVRGGFTVDTPRGVAIHLYSAPVINAQQKSVVTDWLTTLATELSDAGLSGRIGTSGTWGPDVGSLIDTGHTFPAAFVGYRLATYSAWGEQFQGWQVGKETTRRVVDGWKSHANLQVGSAAWAALNRYSVPIKFSDVADYLTTTAELVRDSKNLYLVNLDGSAFSKLALEKLGEYVTQTVTLQQPWQELVNAQLKELLIAPEEADVGMIKNIWANPTGWSSVTVHPHHLPVRLPLDYETNRHLWDEYVIDAAGINLLTSKHLSHAHDLSDWTVEQVAPDRFLVSALNPEPWFAGLAAPHDVVEKARTDFGAMILSWETILEKPGPYTITSPSVVGR